MGGFLGPVPAVALELRDNLNYDGDRDGTCSGDDRIGIGRMAFQPGRTTDRRRALACAAVALIARWAMDAARKSSSSGSSGLPTICPRGFRDRGFAEQPNVQTSRLRRPGVDSSSRFGSGGRSFRPLPADPEAVDSVASKQPQAAGSPAPAHVAAWPSDGLLPVAVCSEASACPSTRWRKSASVDSATWASTSVARGLSPFSGCTDTPAETAWPSASVSTASAIHPSESTLLPSSCTAHPLLLGGRAEDIRTEDVPREPGSLLNRQHVFSRNPFPLAYCLRRDAAHPTNQGGTTKLFERDLLHG